ncbi:unnamed protein product [Sphagnum balticum]
MKLIARCTLVVFVVATTVCGVASTRQAEDEIVMHNWAKLYGVSCLFCVSSDRVHSRLQDSWVYRAGDDEGVDNLRGHTNTTTFVAQSNGVPAVDVSMSSDRTDDAIAGMVASWSTAVMLIFLVHMR